MALTEVVIANMALALIGTGRPLTDVDGTIANSTDNTAEKRQAALWYERSRNAVLEAFPWPFARGYATLVLNDDGEDDIWGNEWDYAYDYPADCLRIRRFVNDLSAGLAGFDYPLAGRDNQNTGDSRYHYVVRLHDGDKVILTNVPEDDAQIEYTRLITDVELYTEQFALALAWLLGSRLASTLENADRAASAMQNYEYEIRRAWAASRNEEAPRDPPDGEFVLSRWH